MGLLQEHQVPFTDELSLLPMTFPLCVVFKPFTFDIIITMAAVMVSVNCHLDRV
ncbi:hypothetical protein I79_017468 [Cricetulus griseus]|uniref:Uncharacterized protein n=1 Tax=Cricetulus griseus TaxID=10029 RepID=G3I250_CRIGR|nr:hypothetical protein I79_017468 [Cricetulus griseus]